MGEGRRSGIWWMDMGIGNILGGGYVSSSLGYWQVDV
jgi:hypothetical protein